MLELVNVSARVGNFHLNEISLSVHKPSCHVILGPTGSGKTLLLESIIGLRTPQNGKIILNGSDITNIAIEKRGLSYVPQDLALFPHMTVKENILFPLKIRDSRQNNGNSIVSELIDSLGIGHILDRSVRNLSGGERQRTALARALASGCKYVILDEPLSALHESLKKELWFLLKELQDKYDLALMVVTHDLEEAFFLGDTISVIISGQVQQTGSKKEVYHYPASLQVARFLGVRNFFRMKVQGKSRNFLAGFSDELGTQLYVSENNRYANQELNDCSADVIIGIRSTDIEILSYNSTEINRMGVKVIKTFDKGSSAVVAVEPDGLKKTVEIEASSHVVREFEVACGSKVTIRLPPEKLLIFPAQDFDSSFPGEDKALE